MSNAAEFALVVCERCRTICHTHAEVRVVTPESDTKRYSTFSECHTLGDEIGHVVPEVVFDPAHALAGCAGRLDGLQVLCGERQEQVLGISEEWFDAQLDRLVRLMVRKDELEADASAFSPERGCLVAQTKRPLLL